MIDRVAALDSQLFLTPRATESFLPQYSILSSGFSSVPLVRHLSPKRTHPEVESIVDLLGSESLKVLDLIDDCRLGHLDRCHIGRAVRRCLILICAILQDLNQGSAENDRSEWSDEVPTLCLSLAITLPDTT